MGEVLRVLKPGGTLYPTLYYKWSAFHLFSRFLYYGLLKGWIFTKGYSGLLATIESGADGVRIEPYVKLYSRKEMANLVKNFSIRDLSVRQLFVDHFSPVLRWLVPRKLVRSLDQRLG